MARDLTEEQKQQAIELLKAGVSRKEVCIRIHTRWENLKKFCDENNIPKKKLGIPYKYYDEIFELYTSGNTLQQIHENYFPQFTADQINYICRKKGITRPNGKVAQLNHDYFELIDTEEKAYFLGLLLADGHVDDSKEYSRAISLSLMQEDKYMVEAFAKAVGTNLTVKEYTNSTGFQRKDGKPHVECRIVLHSKKLANDISCYNIVPHKSYLEYHLPFVAPELMRHFIRGFFDGNGSITYSKDNGLTRPKIEIYSNHILCVDLICYLNNNVGVSLTKVYDQKDARVSFISIGRYSDVCNMYKFMYTDATIYLKRKKKKFEELFRQYRDNQLDQNLLVS